MDEIWLFDCDTHEMEEDFNFMIVDNTEEWPSIGVEIKMTSKRNAGNENANFIQCLEEKTWLDEGSAENPMNLSEQDIYTIVTVSDSDLEVIWTPAGLKCQQQKNIILEIKTRKTTETSEISMQVLFQWNGLK